MASRLFVMYTEQRQLLNLELFSYYSTLALRWVYQLKLFYLRIWWNTMCFIWITMGKLTGLWFAFLAFCWKVEFHEEICIWIRLCSGDFLLVVLLGCNKNFHMLLINKFTRFLICIMNAGFGYSCCSWLGCSLCLWAAWSCCNCNWQWPSFIIHCSCAAGNGYEQL